MRSTGVCAALAFVVGCGAVRKPPEPDRRLNVRTSGALFESDRGYSFAVLPEPGANVVRLDVRYPVGSADDPTGKEGLAHLVEHLLFQVEIERAGRRTSVAAEIGRVALAYNAHTAADHTTYVTVAAPAALEEILRLHVDAIEIGCAGLTPAAFEREREVVVNEMRTRQGGSGAGLRRVIYEAVYPPGHPYRRVDSAETVGKLELADVCNFLLAQYRHGKAFVIASGAIDAASLQAAAGKHLGRAPRRDVARAKPTPPLVHPQPGVVRLKADIEEPTLLVTLPLPAMASRDYRLLEMVWPYIPVRMDMFGFTYEWGHSASATVLGGNHAPVLAIGITLASAGKLDDAISAAEKAMQFAARVIYRGGDDRDSPRWREQWQERAEILVARWESLDGRNQLAGDFLQFEADVKVLTGRIDELAAATPKETQAIAETWLSPKRARFILLEPSGTPAPIAHASYAGTNEEHGVEVDPASADQPLPAPRTTLAVATERYQLDNGLTVVMWPHGASPITNGILVVGSGTAHEPRGQEGLASFAGADAFDADVLTYRARELATHVDDLVASLSYPLRWPGERLSDERKAFLRGRLKQQRAQERASYAVAYVEALYGPGHPYARATMTEDSLGHLSHDVVMDWAREHVVPANATLILTGRFDPALVRKHVAYNADQVARGEDSSDEHPAAVTRQAWVRGVTAKPSPTVTLEVGFVGGRGVDRDMAHRMVLARVLTTQLAQLRGKRALSYGVIAAYNPLRAGGRWSLVGDVDATRAAEGAAMLASILADMRAGATAYRTAFVLARQKILEELLASATDSALIAERLAFLARWDLPASYFDTVAASVAAMTLADLHGFVQRELAFDKQVFGAFGNAEAVDAALAAAQAVPPVAKAALEDPFQ